MIAEQGGTGACEDNDLLQEGSMDRGEGELPLLFETREVGEKLADAGCFFEGGEVLEHLVNIQSL